MKKYYIFLIIFCVSCQKNLIVENYESDFKELIKLEVSDSDLAQFLLKIPKTEVKMIEHLCIEYSNYKISKLTAIEKRLIKENELESRNLPCFGAYVDSMGKAVIGLTFDIFSLDSYYLDNYIERTEKAENAFYDCMTKTYG